MSSTTDRLYRVDSVPDDFEFNERVVEVFVDMLDRSMPFSIKENRTLFCRLQTGLRVAYLNELP